MYGAPDAVVRLAFALWPSRDRSPIEITVHPVFRGGCMGDTPMKEHTLRAKAELDLMLTAGLAVVLHRGDAEQRTVDLSHADPEIPRWLELTYIVLDGSTSTELRRSRIRPGDTETVRLDVADVVVVRLLPEGVEGHLE